MIISELRAARHRRGITLADLSQLSGIAQPNLSRLERERVDPRLSTLRTIADALGFELTLSPRNMSSLATVRTRMEQGVRRLSDLGVTDRQADRRLEWKRKRDIDTSVEEELLR